MHRTLAAAHIAKLSVSKAHSGQATGKTRKAIADDDDDDRLSLPSTAAEAVTLCGRGGSEGSVGVACDVLGFHVHQALLHTPAPAVTAAATSTAATPEPAAVLSPQMFDLDILRIPELNGKHSGGKGAPSVDGSAMHSPLALALTATPPLRDLHHGLDSGTPETGTHPGAAGLILAGDILRPLASW